MAKLRITALDGEHQGEVLESQSNPRLSSVDRILHHPRKVTVAWGSAAGAMPRFDGVVEAVSVRYLKFTGNGVPLRATATVKLKEAVDLPCTLARG